MATRGRVRKTNVSTTNIRDVADIDYSISKQNTTGDELFTDNDLAGKYIDPQYCAGDSDEERLSILTSKEYAIGEFRNYGGDESPSDDLPEIYFKSIIGTGFEGGTPIEFAPQSQEAINYINYNDLIVSIAAHPRLDKIDDFESQTITDSKALLDKNMSVIFRDGNEDALNDSSLATKVGVDYTGVVSKNPIYSYRITSTYGDMPFEVEVNNPWKGTAIKALTSFYTPKFKDLDETIRSISQGAEFSYFFDYLNGGNSPIYGNVRKVVDKVSRSVGETLLGTLFQAVALYTTIIIQASAIWDSLQNETNTPDGIFQYKNLVDGVYTFDDVKKSKMQLGFGSIFTGKDNFYSQTIETPFIENTYEIPANDIEYPKDNGASKQYANFKFFPKCPQYDLMTPPPIITFKIELIANANCKLSSTKPTAFTISVAPDKYIAPKFDVITPSGRASQGKPDIYINTPIEFVNAKYVDFIALLDREKNGGWFNLFKIYQNSYINSDGRDDHPYTNRSFKYEDNGSIVNTAGASLVLRNGVNNYPASSEYEVAFMQEYWRNLVKNSTFRLERLSEDPYHVTNFMKKFWTYSSDWQIRDGAIYRDVASNLNEGVYQDISLKSRSDYFYFLDIECENNTGWVGVDLSTSFSNNIYSWVDNDSYYLSSGNSRKAVKTEDYPTGVSLNSNALRFASGKYRVLLRANQVDSLRLKMSCSDDYTGRINFVCLQPLPYGKIDDNKRMARNAGTEYGQNKLYVKWNNAYLSEKTINLQFNIDQPTTVHIKFKPKQSESSYYKTTITWQQNKSPDIIDGLSYQEYDMSHSYLIPGIYNVTIKNEIPALNLRNEFESFTCNEESLIYFNDASGLLYNGILDLSFSNIGLFGSLSLKNNTSGFKTPLYSLNISNTPITGGIDQLPRITQYLNVSNTNVTGNAVNIYGIAVSDISNTNIIKCSTISQPSGNDGNKSITWINTLITEAELINLIRAIDLSNIESGYLDISGDNVSIFDQDTLDRITMLTTPLGDPDGLGGIGRGWTILYNGFDPDNITDAILTEDSLFYLTTENSFYYIKQE